MNDYSGYEVINIAPLPRIENGHCLTRSGLKFVCKLPAIVTELRYIERKKLVAFTPRGAFWIREGKKPRRIQAKPIVYRWTPESITICCLGKELLEA